MAMHRSSPGASRFTAGIFIAALVSVLLFSSGCNVFEPFHTPGSSDDPDDLLYDARRALDDGRYGRAKKIMDKAIRIAPDEPRVRYVHAVVVVKANGVDMLDVLEILEPGEDNLPAGGSNERVLAESEEDLKVLFDTFRTVSVDLGPLVDELSSTGRSPRGITETDDLLMSYGISETILGMLRVIDNDDTTDEFSSDERIVIARSPGAYDIDIDDVVMTPQEVDDLIDGAIGRAWPHFVSGRASFFRYYQYAVRRVLWTGPVAEPPAPYPETVDTGTVIGEILEFVDDNARTLYEEKEDVGGVMP
jgi:hypothetical protein